MRVYVLDAGFDTVYVLYNYIKHYIHLQVYKMLLGKQKKTCYMAIHKEKEAIHKIEVAKNIFYRKLVIPENHNKNIKAIKQKGISMFESLLKAIEC